MGAWIAATRRADNAAEQRPERVPMLPLPLSNHDEYARTGFAHVNDPLPAPRSSHHGRTYLYLLPCRHEDLLKLGFSRDPLQRFSTLHPRFFELFDLDRGLLVETPYLRDARRLERRLITAFDTARSPAPRVVPRAAAGYTEWFRGVDASATALARQLARDGAFEVHAPLRPWLRARLAERSELLFDWSLRLFEAIEYQRHNPSGQDDGAAAAERALGHALDLFEAVGIDLDARVAPAVAAWQQARHALHW